MKEMLEIMHFVKYNKQVLWIPLRSKWMKLFGGRLSGEV